MMASNTWERIGNAIYSFVLLGSIPVISIVFLTLFFIQVWKVKKKGAGKTKAVVFGCISGYFLLCTIGEIAVVAMLASAVAHM